MYVEPHVTILLLILTVRFTEFLSRIMLLDWIRFQYKWDVLYKTQAMERYSKGTAAATMSSWAINKHMIGFTRSAATEWEDIDT